MKRNSAAKFKQNKQGGDSFCINSRKGSKYDKIKSTGAKIKTMLASEISYIMSEMTARAGKLLTEASFRKTVD